MVLSAEERELRVGMTRSVVRERVSDLKRLKVEAMEEKARIKEEKRRIKEEKARKSHERKTRKEEKEAEKRALIEDTDGVSVGGAAADKKDDEVSEGGAATDKKEDEVSEGGAAADKKEDEVSGAGGDLNEDEITSYESEGSHDVGSEITVPSRVDNVVAEPKKRGRKPKTAKV